MLNTADNKSFSDSVNLTVFGHLTLNFEYFGGIQKVLNSEFLKFQDIGNFELSP